MTAEYASTREQFGHPIAGFQAVSQRAADAYIDTEAMRVDRAAGGLAGLSGVLPAADEVAIAKFWAADGGQRVADVAQHLHGGLGIDVDYPLHRYFPVVEGDRTHARLGHPSARPPGVLIAQT